MADSKLSKTEFIVSLNNNFTFNVESINKNYDVQSGNDILSINSGLLSETDIQNFTAPDNLAKIAVIEDSSVVTEYVGYTDILSINSVINKFQKSTQIVLRKRKE